MRIYTIYEKPADYPDKFVLRGWTVPSGSRAAPLGMTTTNVLAVPVPDVDPRAITDSLAECRKLVPTGLTNIGRNPGDDPHIVECWI